MEFEREQEEAAAAEAAAIGGRRDDTLDYVSPDEARPVRVSEEAWRPVEEGGGGQVDGFEEGEELLIERAENPDGPSPQAQQGAAEDERRETVYGEPDQVRTSEDDPDNPAATW